MRIFGCENVFVVVQMKEYFMVEQECQNVCSWINKMKFWI